MKVLIYINRYKYIYEYVNIYMHKYTYMQDILPSFSQRVTDDWNELLLCYFLNLVSCDLRNYYIYR